VTCFFLRAPDGNVINPEATTAVGFEFRRAVADPGGHASAAGRSGDGSPPEDPAKVTLDFGFGYAGI
jgi:hypothetical protein